MGSVGKGRGTAADNSDIVTDDYIRQRLEDDGYEFTDNPDEAIYILRNGDMVRGFYEGVRSEDHRMIESVFDDIDRYTTDFWKQMFNRTGLLMLIPESNQALTSTSVNLTEEQKKILKKLGYELMKE